MTLTRRDVRVPQGFVNIVEPMDKLLITAERKYEMKKKKLQNEATAEKKVSFTHIYNKKHGPSHGSGSWTRRDDDNRAMMSTSRSFPRGNFQPRNQNSNNFRQNRLFERRDYLNNNNKWYNEYRENSPYRSDQNQSRN